MNNLHAARMSRFTSAGLYLVTSQEVSAGRETLNILEAALKGGVRLVQLREKSLSKEELKNMAIDARRMTNQADALLIINDHLDVAIETGADGIHLGQDDMAVSEARAAAPDLIIGASSHSRAEALAAQDAGASYVNIGPIFPTNTKKWDDSFLGIDGIKEISPCLNIPFTVMGGIKKHHIPELLDAGAQTIALVTAVTEAPDPESAAHSLISIIRGNT